LLNADGLPHYSAMLMNYFGAGSAFVLLSCLNVNGADTSATNEAAFISNARQLTFEGNRSGEGYFSPDGKYLIFQSEREPGNPFYQIYTLDFESGDSHRVSPGFGKTTCGFFRPGSEQVLFASTHLDPAAKEKQMAELELRAEEQKAEAGGTPKRRRYAWDYDDHYDIFAAKRDGSQLVRLTDAPGYDAEGAYSPDGKRIVFSSMRNAYPTNQLSAEDQKRLAVDPSYFAEIYIMDADGSDQKRLTSVPGYDGGPFFSPDGERIIWRRFDEKGTTADVYTMKTDGSDVRRLTAFGCMSWAPYFHPSAKYAIFTANKLGFGNFELFLVDAEGGREPVRVTFTEGFDGLPVFSPDGQKLCWTSARTAGGKSQLFLANWNHDAALSAISATLPRESTASSSAAVPSHASGKTREYLPSITTNDLHSQISFLASDELEGRMTGSAGAKQAAEFASNYFQSLGLKPVGRLTSYHQPFSFTAGVRVVTNANRLSILRKREAGGAIDFAAEKEFRPLSFTADGEVETDVVFAGYGLVVPGKLGEGYDSYAGLDVTNKIVVVLRYVPEEVEPKRRAELNRYAGLRYKAMNARERGAKAILFVTGPNSPNPGTLVPLTFDSSMAGSSILAASINSNVAHATFSSTGKDLKQLQSALDKEDPHAEGGFAIAGVHIKLATGVQLIKGTDNNVLAAIPPINTSEYVMLGAHYDHLGRGESGAMQRAGEENQIHNGADDNASGVAAVLELAGALAQQTEPTGTEARRGVIFALWSGEEIGLVGSTHFAEEPPLALSNIVAYLNFDMVGRLQDNKLTLQGVGSSAFWRKLIEKRNVAAGFDLTLQDDPYLPTDVTPIYPKGIPVLAFFTGSHDDYHRPTDDVEKINYTGLQRITSFAHGILRDLLSPAGRPDYVKVERSSPSGGRENLRAYLGTIPDYTTEVTGVKLSGVRGGSPAEKAGLKGGDVIVQFGGQKIANIYDYTYALDAVKIGQPVEMIIMRGNERLNISVTPEARK
jgi:Tol biopolymer transport system component